jgi:hypothetical protein
MEVDSDGGATAFRSCRSAAGADRAPADAWSSSLAGVSPAGRRRLPTAESSTRHDPGGGGCCAVGSDIVDVLIGGAALVAMRLSISE